MTVRVLGDGDVKRLITMSESVEVMAEACRRHAAGTQVAPARLAAPLEWGQLVFTAGAYSDPAGGRIGFRVYDMEHFGSAERDDHRFQELRLHGFLRDQWQDADKGGDGGQQDRTEA